ncbi:hypothetical protein RI129_005248 [Pyrocoelia pectoralis]|uniref:Lysosome-associated membrane glycoprotein 5 n=1 Tax=Pyrocoelia pectoralis TaxID=417401 RepID=A0AAN7VMD2_9COLE
MTKLIFIFIISAALMIVQGDDINATNHNGFPPQPPPHKDNSSTPIPPTLPPTTKPPTPEPTTKPPPPPPTTKPPTPPPTTQPPTPPPTTQPPTPPPTTKPPTPPPAPAPLPPKPVEPSQGSWEFNDTTNTNATCIKIHFAVQIVIPYLHKARNTTYNATVDIPPSAHVSGGDCVSDKSTESIEIQWMNANNATDNIKFQFVQNVTAKNYQLQEINLNITPDDVAFPGIEDKTPIILKHKSSDEFTTSLFKSYKCEKEQHLNLTDLSNNARGSIHISHLQLQAFGNATNNEFYSAIDCEPTSTPDVVPIAVGCALAILVIVVLVAYLIGRKRRQARGYLSM